VEPVPQRASDRPRYNDRTRYARRRENQQRWWPEVMRWRLNNKPWRFPHANQKDKYHLRNRKTSYLLYANTSVSFRHVGDPASRIVLY
jgi:hypothetical protein